MLAVLASVLLVPVLGLAEDLSAVSDLDLITKTREAVVAQDAETALDLLSEMQRRGTGIFAGMRTGTCEEEIALPEGITDWRFSGAARQAYITAAKTKAFEEGKCGCLFGEFSFDRFTSEVLGKSASDLVNDDRGAIEAYLTQHQRETEARYRDLETVCRSM